MTDPTVQKRFKTPVAETTIPRRANPVLQPTTPPGTPTALSIAANELFHDVQGIYDQLIALPNLAPGERINEILTRLVALCIVPYSREFTKSFFKIRQAEQLCERLRPLCAVAEGELENYWARRIIDEARKARSQDPGLLAMFPYHQNYLDLSRLEVSALEAFLPSSLRKIAFIGSGPLPLTSLCILKRYPDAVVHNIDRDLNALSVSEQLCALLGFRGMKFAHEDVTAASQVDWTTFDVVFLAALVGTDTASKIDILASLAGRLEPGTLVVARSAHGLRSVLYPILELAATIEETGLEVLAEVHPWTKVVNSVVLFRVKER